MTEADRLRRLRTAGRSPLDPAPDRPQPPPARSVIAVCSGKGGVGKSTIALNLAIALALRGERVGLLDADIHAADIPLMVGLARRKPATGWTLSRPGGFDRTPVEPVEKYGVKLMSSGFIVAEDQALTLSAELVEVLLNQLVFATMWGPLDRLVIDLPPGTTHLVQAVFRVLPSATAVIVVTPQDVSHLDNRRVLTALRAANVAVLGGVENMAELRCPHCGNEVAVFPRVAHERSIWLGGLPRLGRIPLAAMSVGDGGEPVVFHAPDSPRGAAMLAAADAVRLAADGAGGDPAATAGTTDG